MIVGSVDERLQPGLVVLHSTELLDRSDLLIAIVDSLLQIFEREREGSLEYKSLNLKNTHTDSWIQTKAQCSDPYT